MFKATNVTLNSFSNLPGRQHQPYISWKGNKNTNQSTISAVASNSRPPSESPIDTINMHTPVFINQRQPIASKHNAKGTANPIKHWRKQLISTNESITGRVSVGQAMDRPGGSVYLAKVNEKYPLKCNENQNTKTQLITNYLYDYNVSKSCTGSNNCQTYKNSNGVTISTPVYNPQRITRPGSTILKKNYYTTSTAYLKSRVKLYEQNQSIVPIKGNDYYNSSSDGEEIYVQPTDSSKGSQVYDSTYSTDALCSTPVVKIIYKPSNYEYSKPSAVSSGLRTVNIKIQEINKSAHNLKNNFGQYSANAAKYRGVYEAPYTLKSKYQKPNSKPCLSNQTSNSRRQPVGGTGKHTVCFYTPSSDIKTNLSGTVLSRAKGVGSWAKGPILPQKNECQIILEALGEILNTPQYYDDFEFIPANFPDPGYDPAPPVPPILGPPDINFLPPFRGPPQIIFLPPFRGPPYYNIESEFIPESESDLIYNE